MSRAGLVMGVGGARSSARGVGVGSGGRRAGFGMDLEFHQLEMRYEHLHLRRAERERRLLASLAERGQQVPIVVVALCEDPGRYQVIDGHKRVRLLRRLGQDTVCATVWDMSEAEALVLDRALRAADSETAIEQAWLLQELRNLPLSLEDLAKQFDRSVGWVSQRLGLVQVLPLSVQEHIRAGLIPAQAAMKYLVPLARAKREDCEALSESIAKHHFTSREVGELYRAWREGPWDMRRRVLEDPALFLRAQRELEEEHPVEVRAAEGLLRDLDLVGRLARRVERRWKEGCGVMEPREREEVRGCLEQALMDLGRLLGRIEKEEGCAEGGRADGGPGASQQRCRQEADCPDAAAIARGGPEGDPTGLGHLASHQPGGEGRALSERDPGALHLVPGEPGPSP